MLGGVGLIGRTQTGMKRESAQACSKIKNAFEGRNTWKKKKKCLVFLPPLGF